MLYQKEGSPSCAKKKQAIAYGEVRFDELLNSFSESKRGNDLPEITTKKGVIPGEIESQRLRGYPI